MKKNLAHIVKNIHTSVYETSDLFAQWFRATIRDRNISYGSLDKQIQQSVRRELNRRRAELEAINAPPEQFKKLNASSTKGNAVKALANDRHTYRQWYSNLKLLTGIVSVKVTIETHWFDGIVTTYSTYIDPKSHVEPDEDEDQEKD